MKNTFFYTNGFFIYLLNHQSSLIYNFIYLNNHYYLEIKNKEHRLLNIHFKIVKNNKYYDYKINKENSNFIKLKQFEHLNFQDSFNIPSIKKVLKLFPHFNENYYKQNLDINEKYDNNDFYIYHWYYCGQYDKYQYWKYILYKNAHYFYQLNNLIDFSINYDSTKKYTLAFIDDRFDDIFIFILIMFKYSINNQWNVHIISQKKHYNSYKKVCDQLNIEFKYINVKPFLGIENYSSYLKNADFWNLFSEDYLLIFQYDSCAFKKFDHSFFKYNYLGAQWPFHIQQNKGIFNGNGGTSLRNIKLMSYICNKYFYKLNDEKTPEDVYFSKYLYQESLLENNPTLCNDFSMENIKCEYSVFGHAIYESISLDDLENFFISKIQKMIN